MDAPTDCPDANAFAAFMGGFASDAERHGIETHLDRCATCAEVLGAAARQGDEAVPARLGRYQIIGVIGEGAMGRVYEAHDPTLERAVAVKILHPALDARAGARLVAEAKTLGRIAHSHVVRVLDAGEHDGRYFIAMELVAGQTLAAWLAEGRRSVPEIVAVFAQVGSGLAAAHAAGVIHRDVKPENVLVHDGRAVVIDFGLAVDDRAVIRPREVAGTRAYMAPEQTDGAAGPATDQYAFCIALHLALYGSLPNGPPTSPIRGDVPRWLDDVIARGLAHDPSQRWPSMNTLVTQLRDAPAADDRSQRRLNALFQVLLWPFHVAINLLMWVVLTSPAVAPNSPGSGDATVDFLAGAMATWLIGAFLTGWAPLGLVWTLVNAYGLSRGRRWAYRSTVVYYLFALPSIVGTPVALYGFVTLWRKAFPKEGKRG